VASSTQQISLKQTVVITGASSGIGACTAEVFAKNNFNMLLIGRDLKKLDLVKSKCFEINPGIQVEILSLDMKNYVSSIVMQTIEKLEPVTVLVNNAGIYLQKSFEQTTDADWAEQFEVNLLGSIRLTRDLWPIFEKQKNGSIINVSSTLAHKPVANASAYSAIKAAMVNWTLGLAIEGGTHNIRANCICPGIIDTPIHPFHSLTAEKKQDVETSISKIQLLKKLGQPIDVAESIYFLASDKSSFTTGSILNIDGGINIK
jgi:NAD(P)-dependent dehydrogenase (short-subunit alcohol dehydrogenase family)